MEVENERFEGEVKGELGGILGGFNREGPGLGGDNRSERCGEEGEFRDP